MTMTMTIAEEGHFFTIPSRFCTPPLPLPLHALLLDEMYAGNCVGFCAS